MVNAICKELEIRKQETTELKSIYLGGGTPGLLSEAEIDIICKCIYTNYKVDAHAEFTIEVNPDDMTKEKLSTYLKSGINRLSVGTQSFFDEDLKYMNRVHNAHAASHCVQLAQDIGINNISIDLIYGYPLLSNTKWMHNLQMALNLQVNHLSCYAMTVEPKTALAQFIKVKKELPIENEQAAAQFDMLMQWAANNSFEHYEISNFALKSKYAVHNTNYWKGVHYMGIGPSAHSYNGHSRFWNIANNKQYINQLLISKWAPEVEVLKKEDKINEAIMLGLRTTWGISLKWLKANLPSTHFAEVQAYIKLNNEYFMLNPDNIILNNWGKQKADTIASDLFLI